MKINNKVIWTIVFSVVLSVCSTYASPITVALTVEADSDIREGVPDSPSGDRTEHYIANTTGDSAKIYFRFRLPADFGTATSAAFKITRTAQVAAWDYDYTLYGMDDGVVGQDWVEVHSLTWNNSPTNDTGSGYKFTNDAGVLGKFWTISSTHGATGGEEYAISTTVLEDFLDNDSDRVVTLMLSRQAVSSSWDGFASKENGTYNPPTLELTYEPISLEITSLTTVADSDIREGLPDYASGDRASHYIQNNPGDAAKIYFRFELPADVKTVTGATFKITQSLVNGSWDMPYQIYGLNDNAGGQDWVEVHSLTWNNASANDTASSSAFTSDATGALGTFNSSMDTVGQEFTISTDALVDFLKTDTDGVVNIMMSRDIGWVAGAYDEFASKENGTYNPPTLEVTYEPLPTVALTTVADSDIREGLPDYASGDRASHYIQNNPGDAAKIYFRFELPADVKTVTGATFKITQSLVNGSWDMPYQIYGLNDNAGGQDWVEVHSLTWNNASANDTASLSAFTSDATGALGTFNSSMDTVGQEFTISTDALVDFLKTDTDGVVNIMMSRDIGWVAGAYDEFASKENGTYNPPTLEVTYEPLDFKNTALTTASDSDVREGVPDYGKGDRLQHYICNTSGDSAKIYMNFELPEDFGTAVSATIKIVRSNALNAAWNFLYNLHGLNDDVAGQYWGGHELTWNNAPANDTTSPSLFTSDATGILGSFLTLTVDNGGFDGDLHSISTSDLVNFINTDTDGIINLMLARDIGYVSASFDYFASEENETYAGPTLELSYIPACGAQLSPDRNGDCYVNLSDYALVAEDWLETDPNFINLGDVYPDGHVNLDDLKLVAEAWLTVCSDTSNHACDSYWMPAELAKTHWNQWRTSWDTFPIGAWSYFHDYTGDVAEYTVYEQANMTMVQAPLDQYQNAVAAGLKPVIGTWDALYLDPIKLQNFMQTPTAVDQNLAAYLLKDDVRKPDSALLEEPTYAIYLGDHRGAIPIANVLPSYGDIMSTDPSVTTYEEYVDQYIKFVSPAVLQYAFYPLQDNGSDLPGFYDNIELIRKKSLDAEIGFMGITGVTAYTGDSIGEPNEPGLNWEVYSLITYGAKGIWYWNYRIDPTGGFGEGLVTHAAGTPRDTYFLAQAINAELKAMGPTLLSLKSTSVYHADAADPDNPSIKLYNNGNIAVLSDFASTQFILGEFGNMDDVLDTDTYLMVTNKRHSGETSAAEAANAIFTANPTSLNVYKFNTTSESWDLLVGASGTYTVNIGGGKGVLLRFSSP